MSPSRFVDTNILLYSISTSRDEVRKHTIAVELLESDDLALSVQVLQEFYVQATRQTRPDAIAHEIAVGLIRTWLRFSVQESTIDVMLAAFDIKARYQLSYWDAAIVAAARTAGCHEVLTEDMSHGLDVNGVAITNPFVTA
jgi:predicted nucleic acid-binding protein